AYKTRSISENWGFSLAGITQAGLQLSRQPRWLRRGAVTSGHSIFRLRIKEPDWYSVSVGNHKCLLTIPLVIFIGEENFPFRSSLTQHHHADHPPRASVPLDSLRQSALHKLDSFHLRHPIFPVRVAITVDIRRPRPANRIALFM